MRVVLAAAGSLGDVVPFVALADRFRRQGHEVVLITHRPLLHLVPHGIRALAADSDPAVLLSGPAGDAVGHASPRALNRTRDLFADFVHSFAAPTRDALDGADVLLASTFAMASVHEALRRPVPVVRAHLWPEHPGLDGPMPLFPFSWVLPRHLRRCLRAGLQRFEPYLGGVQGRWRRGRLILRARHPVRLTTATLGTLHAYSPTLVSGPRDDVCVTGWWVPEHPGALSARTTEVLRSGGDWAYVGFGSMPETRPDVLLDLVTDACDRAGLRPVVQLPGFDGRHATGPVFIGPEPHDRLFPQMRVVVHHGGSGTTGAAVRAGTPSVVVPHLADQFFWGHRVHANGAGSKLLPRRRLTARRLADRLEQALTDPVRQGARALAERVSREDGTAVAVRHVEQMVAQAGVVRPDAAAPAVV